MLWAMGMLTCPAVHANRVIVIRLIFLIFLIFFFPMFRHACHLLLNGIDTNLGSTTLASTVAVPCFLSKSSCRVGPVRKADMACSLSVFPARSEGSLVSRCFACVG